MGKTVILGGSGTIGLRLCSAFDATSGEVIATWRSRKPSPFDNANLRKVRWQEFPKTKDEWSSLLGEADTVFHLANELWNYSKILADPRGPLREEPRKNEAILQACLDSRVKKLVWLSSSIAYGDGRSKDEDDFFSGNSEAPYDSWVSCIRDYERLLTRGYPSLDLRIFRPTTVVGPPARRPSEHSHIFVRILDNLINQGRATIYSPDPKRNFLFSDDLSKLFLKEASLAPQPGEAEAYNVRGGSNWSLSQLALEATQQLGLDPSVVEVVHVDRTPTVIDLPDAKIRRRHLAPSSDLERVVRAILTRMVELRQK